LPSGRAPKCYARMQELIDAARFPEPVS
jgi:hypothetical protein